MSLDTWVEVACHWPSAPCTSRSSLVALAPPAPVGGVGSSMPPPPRQTEEEICPAMRPFWRSSATDYGCWGRRDERSAEGSGGALRSPLAVPLTRAAASWGYALSACGREAAHPVGPRRSLGIEPQGTQWLVDQLQGYLDLYEAIRTTSSEPVPLGAATRSGTTSHRPRPRPLPRVAHYPGLTCADAPSWSASRARLPRFDCPQYQDLAVSQA